MKTKPIQGWYEKTEEIWKAYGTVALPSQVWIINLPTSREENTVLTQSTTVRILLLWPNVILTVTRGLPNT